MGGKAALIHIIGFGIILGYISNNLNDIANRAQGNMSNYASSSESHNIAVAGANVALARFYQDTSWRGTVTQNLAGVFNGTFTYSIANQSNGKPLLRSVSSVLAAEGTVRDTVEVTFGNGALQSFSLFAWMSNNEGNVFWFTQDSIWGRVHSNGNIHMSGVPVFMEKVTTAKTIDPKVGSGGNNAVFKKGYETGVAEIAFPNDLSQLFNAATAGGKAYAGNVEVRLYGGTAADNDGYALVYSGATKIDSINLNAAGFNGVITSTGRVSVKGVLDGKLSIGSLQDVYILDNITYENRNTSTSDDVLGLVAEANVVVADNTANHTDCEIDGSVFTRTGSFMAENYNSGSPRGLLRVTGSIVQDDRGPVGTFNNGQSTIKTGYSKRYYYDKRLSDPNFRPPYYPGFYAKTYAIASWWENVHIPKFY
jgi:hypothetical protein